MKVKKMASYVTQREKVSEYITKYIIPALKLKDLDYYETVKYIAGIIGASESLVENVLSGFAASGKLREVRLLTILENELNDFIKDMKQREKDIKEVDEQLDKLEEDAIKKEED